MAVEQEGKWIESSYRFRGTVGDWGRPMPSDYTRRAATLADALAGNWLPMEVEG